MKSRQSKGKLVITNQVRVPHTKCNMYVHGLFVTQERCSFVSEIEIIMSVNLLQIVSFHLPTVPIYEKIKADL
jgi:hypothetical protein